MPAVHLILRVTLHLEIQPPQNTSPHLILPSFPGDSVIENLPANAGDVGLTPGLRRSPEEGKWQPSPVFLPGKFHGYGSLADYIS